MEHNEKPQTNHDLQQILEAIAKMSERIHAIEHATWAGSDGVKKIASSVDSLATQQREEMTSVASIAKSIEQYTGATTKPDAEGRRARHQRLSDLFWSSKTGTHYPDISEWYPPGATDADKDAIDARNVLRERMYYALIFIFTQRFSFKAPGRSPDWFDEWTGDGEAAVTRFLGVHGLLLADNFTDPLLLRPEGTTFTDDVLGEVKVRDRDGANTDYAEVTVPVRVARRFFDAAVGAVQRYTARADLFAKVRGQLLRKGASPITASSQR